MLILQPKMNPSWWSKSSNLTPLHATLKKTGALSLKNGCHNNKSMKTLLMALKKQLREMKMIKNTKLSLTKVERTNIEESIP